MMKTSTKLSVTVAASLLALRWQPAAPTQPPAHLPPGMPRVRFCR
jgi:hypothetical protein